MLNLFRIKYYSGFVKKNAIKALNGKEETPLFQHESEVDLADNLSEFFKEKIKTIQKHLYDSHIVSDNSNKWKYQPMFATELTDFKGIVHRMANTRWTPSGEWMLGTKLYIVVYILLTIFGATFLSGESNLMLVLLKMF